MYKLERKKQILNLLEEVGFCSTQELADRLGVSQTTIYRDLSELEEAGAITKEYGGVTLVGQVQYASHIDFNVRQMQHMEEKRAIAAQAIDMIEDGDSIFLDASSTCFILAQELAYRQVRDLTIITNSPRIVLTLRDNPECKTISTGGTYLKQFDSLAGAPAEEYVETLSVKKCFFSVLGVSTHACTDSEQLEVTLKKLILSRAMIKILLADHSKFTRFATFKVIETADLDILITDWLTPADDMSLYKELGLEVIRAGLEDNKT